MTDRFTRRTLLQSATWGTMAGGMLGTGLISTTIQAAETEPGQSPIVSPAQTVRFCFNTSCIREAGLTLPQLVDLVAEAGYSGIEPWISEIDQFVKEGGNLGDLRKQLADRNLQVESAIGFPRWAVNEERERAAGFEEAKRGMDLVRQLGGSRIAAPPIGINTPAAPLVNLDDVALRYRQLLELGVTMQVIPQLEIWGSSKNLSRLAEALYVAVGANHSAAAILPDVYHLYRGGSDFDCLRLLSGQAIQVFHINDYPAEPAREQQTDADRVYPGDGVAPLELILGTLKQIGFTGALSLELFNREYWKQDPASVAKTGLQKMKAVASKFWNV